MAKGRKNPSCFTFPYQGKQNDPILASLSDQRRAIRPKNSLCECVTILSSLEVRRSPWIPVVSFTRFKMEDPYLLIRPCKLYYSNRKPVKLVSLFVCEDVIPLSVAVFVSRP